MKHLLELATKEAKELQKQYDWLNDDNLNGHIDYEYKQLLAVRKALLDGRLYLGVESVSASDMSRIIKIKYVSDNKLHNVVDLVYKIAGCDKNHRISGCGMDMLFHAQYNLFVTLCPKMDYTKKMPRYNSL